MRIVILSDDFPPYGLGGASTVAFEDARGLANLGHEVFVISTVQEKMRATEAELFEDIPVYRLFSNYPKRWRAYVSLYNYQLVGRVEKILNELKPDIVHAHNIHTHLSYRSLALAKKTGAAVFLTAHDVMLFHYGKLTEFIDHTNLSVPTSFNYRVTPWQQLKRFKKRYNPFRNIVIRHYLTYVDTLFAVSNSLKEALAQNKIMKSEVLYNSIDISNWKKNEFAVRELQEKYNLENKKVILYIGRLNRAKGGQQIVHIVKKVLEKVPDAILFVVGSKAISQCGQNSVEAVEQTAKSEGVTDNIIFSEWLQGESLRTAYYAADVEVLPSVCLDTFGMVNLEAMSAEKPVVATCFGGSPEVVEDKKTGYIINPLNHQDSANKIIEILTNPTLAKAMGEAGRKRAENVFSTDQHLRQLLDWYTRFAPKVHHVVDETS